MLFQKRWRSAEVVPNTNREPETPLIQKQLTGQVEKHDRLCLVILQRCTFFL